MTADWGPEEFAMLSPEEAFAVLGDEARLEILRTLGEADEPLAYSELFARMEYDDSSNFSYHLDRLVGHFVGKIDEGYVLRRPGERVVEAILSGAVTTDPVRELTGTEKPCPFCSAPLKVGYQHERVTMHCPECPGQFEHAEPEEGTESGNLGIRPLPPAGVLERTAGEMYQVSKTWTATSMQAITRGVCPRCSGTVEHAVHVCEPHDAGEGTCSECGMRFGAIASAACTNCIFDMEAPVAGHLSVHPESMGFLIDHGIDPAAPEEFHPFAAVDETIRSHQPFEARYEFTVDDDALVLTVNEELTVVEASRRPVARSD